MPVSYTHLDVYKRQVRMFLISVQILFFSTAMECGRVAYTLNSGVPQKIIIDVYGNQGDHEMVRFPKSRVHGEILAQ